MKASPLFYELSQEADKDLEEIFNYTVEKFGWDQAVVYLNGFEDVFNNIYLNPQMGENEGR